MKYLIKKTLFIFTIMLFACNIKSEQEKQVEKIIINEI
jgi:hypothetical protein